MHELLSIHPVAEGVWRFHEASPFSAVDAYLVVGADRAVMIDALESCTGLVEEARKLTDRPLSLAVTHGHFDHGGAALDEFIQAGCPVYMELEDIPVLEEHRHMRWPEGTFHPYPEAFDLGGVKLEAYRLPGHTQGSVVLLDRENARLYSGDAVGSGGFWMQLEECLPFQTFLENLRAFRARLEPLSDVTLYPGHIDQSPVPLTTAYLDDVETAVVDVLEGRAPDNDQVMQLNGKTLPFRIHAVGLLTGGMWYKP